MIVALLSIDRNDQLYTFRPTRTVSVCVNGHAYKMTTSQFSFVGPAPP